MLSRIAKVLAIATLVMSPLNAFAEKSGGPGGAPGNGGHAGAAAGHVGGGRVGGAGIVRGGGGQNIARNVSRGTHVRAQQFTTRAVVHAQSQSAQRRVVRVAGRRGAEGGDRGHHYSHRRHFYHGRYFAYGIGPCWAYSTIYGEYYWTCGDDDDDNG